MTGEAAIEHGLDLRMFVHPGFESKTLEAAVRFGDFACIGRGLGTSVHGGAVESALDEATAELAKIKLFPMATTYAIDFKIKKAVRADTILTDRRAAGPCACHACRPPLIACPVRLPRSAVCAQVQPHVTYHIKADVVKEYEGLENIKYDVSASMYEYVDADKRLNPSDKDLVARCLAVMVNGPKLDQMNAK